MSFGYQVVWNRNPGERAVYEESGFETRDEMYAARDELLREIGWTPPRWWQYWRWDDTRLPRKASGATE